MYKYLAGGSDYVADDRDTKLAQRADEIATAVADLLRLTAGIIPDGKPLPAVADATSYGDLRVQDQVDRCYRYRAAQYQRLVSRLQRVGAALGGLAVVLGALAATTRTETLAAWVPVVTTVVASLTAHIAASRYQYQIVEFLRTAQQLEHLQGKHRRHELADPQFIDESERVISVENQAWMTLWTKPN